VNALLENVHVRDEFTHLLLEALDLRVFESLFVQGFAPQSILGPGQEPLFPLLSLGPCQVIVAVGATALLLYQVVHARL